MVAGRTTRGGNVVRRLWVAGLAAAALVSAGAANAQMMSDEAGLCPGGTQNVWILSGYCAAHDKWDRYFCQCGYEQRVSEGGGSDDVDDEGRGRTLDDEVIDDVVDFDDADGDVF
jgi:hypothetical protein